MQQRDRDDYVQPVSDDAGNPGDTGIEIEETGRSGVYPASGPLPPGDAPVRGQEAWGQGPAGEAGYQDAGTSEIDSTQQLGMRPGGAIPGDAGTDPSAGTAGDAGTGPNAGTGDDTATGGSAAGSVTGSSSNPGRGMPAATNRPVREEHGHAGTADPSRADSPDARRESRDEAPGT